MEQQEVKAKAQEIFSWLQDAVGDVAYSFDDAFTPPEWKKRIQKARRSGVSDIQGWLADELYNDVDTLRDLIGDRIYDAGRGEKEAMIAIAQEIKGYAHAALTQACDSFIADRE